MIRWDLRSVSVGRYQAGRARPDYTPLAIAPLPARLLARLRLHHLDDSPRNRALRAFQLSDALRCQIQRARMPQDRV
jgi:hypothetical protein